MLTLDLLGLSRSLACPQSSGRKGSGIAIMDVVDLDAVCLNCVLLLNQLKSELIFLVNVEDKVDNSIDEFSPFWAVRSQYQDRSVLCLFVCFTENSRLKFELDSIDFPLCGTANTSIPFWLKILVDRFINVSGKRISFVGARVHLSFFLQITDSDVTEDPTV